MSNGTYIGDPYTPLKSINAVIEAPAAPLKILLVEEGSVDTEKLDELNIKYIVYLQGSIAPTWLEV